MAIKIITDSTSDLTGLNNKETSGLEILPLSVIFDEVSYLDGVDLSNSMFYQMLAEATTLPTTSQINPDVFYKTFSKYVEQGDEVIAILLASKLSGTFQSAKIAKDMLEEKGAKIHLIDSQNVTLGLGLLVVEAVDLVQQGVETTEIVAKVNEMVGKLKLFAIIDTLKYLKMGGRISATTAIVGEVLGINPLVQVMNGEIIPIAKARGRKAGMKWLAKQIKQYPPDYNHRFVFGHTNAPEALAECSNYFLSSLPINKYFASNIGCVVGTHAGPGCVGIAYIAK